MANRKPLSAEDKEFLREQFSKKPKWDLVELLLSNTHDSFLEESLKYFREGGKA